MSSGIGKSHDNDKAFSSIDLVCQCLIDGAKTTAFENTLLKYVKPKDVVLDIGTGSGILALLAARAGAKKVYAIEFDDYVADVARENIKINTYNDKIIVLTDDARTLRYTKEQYFHIVVMEMLTTGMVDEFQVQAINNLHSQNAVDKHTTFIPRAQETHITLSNTNFENCGFNMKMVRHLWKHDKNDGLVEPLSDSVILNRVDFSAPIDERFKINKSIKVNRDGLINSVYLTSKTQVDTNTVLESTHSLNASVAVPMPEKSVREGDVVNLEVSYRFGYGYGQFEVKYTCLDSTPTFLSPAQR